MHGSAKTNISSTTKSIWGDMYKSSNSNLCAEVDLSDSKVSSIPFSMNHAIDAMRYAVDYDSNRQQATEAKKSEEVPFWDCLDGNKGSKMSTFCDSTLRNMKASLQRHKQAYESGSKYNKYYLKNIEEKLAYTKTRLGE